MTSRKTVLITGAGGYIGSTLCEHLLKNGFQVIAYDRYFFGKEVLADLAGNPGLIIVQKDIRDCEVADFKGVDVVCDLAALSNDPSGDMDPELTRQINCLGRQRVAQKAKEAGVGHYILSSSCSVYGDGAGSFLTEQSPAHPLTEYARSSLAAEQGAIALADDNFTVTVFRLATVFGVSRRMRFDLVINIMTLHAVEKGIIHILGAGDQWRPLVHVRDVARAFHLAMTADRAKIQQQIFNIGHNDQNLQVLAIAYTVREALPFPVRIERAPADVDKRDYKVCFDKVREKLGFAPEMTPSDGAREVYDNLKRGRIGSGPRTSTVQWYKYLMEADRIIQSVKLGGRLLQ